MATACNAQFTDDEFEAALSNSFQHFRHISGLKREQKLCRCVNGVDRPTRLLRFVAFVHLPFYFRSLHLFVASLLLMKGTSYYVIRTK